MLIFIGRGLFNCGFKDKRLGMKFRKMAVIPSKADPEKQEIFLNDSLEPNTATLKI